MLAVITADTICTAVETAVRTHIDSVLAAYGWATQLGTVKTFQQVPDLNAVAAANLPAIMVGGARVDFSATKSGSLLDGVWQIAVGVRDRGKDHADTAQRIRRWASAITAAVMLDQSLAGLATAINPTSAHYDELGDVTQARTIASAAVVFEINVADAIDMAALREQITPSSTVVSVHPTVGQ